LQIFLVQSYLQNWCGGGRKQRRATPDVRLCWKRPGRPKPCTHAPCNFRSVPLPRLSLLPLLSKVRATSSACSHEKTPPITHIIRSTEKRGPRCGQHTCQISSRSSLGFGLLVVSHNFLPSVYSSHATYTRHFRSNFAARGLGFRTTYLPDFQQIISHLSV